ncbi:hypothetical protein AMTR_s00042p00101940 [Amborella trichopoda]|uniref:Uncharacterized protein n=1 Tax=Amborella trichopoda TaxID=13333 RepID=W1P6L9_AMBTC|nr:hypothetical protein AMTR_s00042p00101940 [Amborella trichopoda]
MYKTNESLTDAACPHMLRIVETKDVFRESGAACEFSISAPFFISGSPFSVGGPIDNVYIDFFCGVLSGVTTKTKEAMYLLSVRGCILRNRGMGDRQLGDYFPHCFSRQHDPNQGCCFTVFGKKYGKKGELQDHEALGASCEAWSKLDMRMVWETSLFLQGLSKFVWVK